MYSCMYCNFLSMDWEFFNLCKYSLHVMMKERFYKSVWDNNGILKHILWLICPFICIVSTVGYYDTKWSLLNQFRWKKFRTVRLMIIACVQYQALNNTIYVESSKFRKKILSHSVLIFVRIGHSEGQHTCLHWYWPLCNIVWIRSIYVEYMWCFRFSCTGTCLPHRFDTLSTSNN